MNATYHQERTIGNAELMPRQWTIGHQCAGHLPHWKEIHSITHTLLGFYVHFS